MFGEKCGITPGLYKMPDEPVGPKILIPGFESAVAVRGAFGWFSAGWIQRLAPGLAVYLARESVAPIDFTVSPQFFAAERAVVESSITSNAEAATQRIAHLFADGRIQATALGAHALDCMAWMIATSQLKLRIAVPTRESNYHPKIWLFDDGYHQVLARGSGNATGRGVGAGVEQLDVDVTWNEFCRQRVQDGISILDDWSKGRSCGIESVFDLPDAIRHSIIQTAPTQPPTMSDYRAASEHDGNPSWADDAAERLRKRFAPPSQSPKSQLSIPDWLEWRTGDFSHQGEAVDEWEASGVPRRGTLAMATGSGKTLTALICASRLQDDLQATPLLIVISAPSKPLVMQWQEEVTQFGVTPTVPALERNSTDAITTAFRRLEAGGTHVLIVTNRMLCSSDFRDTLSAKIQQADGQFSTMLIGDEAHSLGADGFISNKPNFFEHRLALSATPERQYDPDGTEEIFEFFGRPVYEFGLRRAIGFCLTPYQYLVHATTLDGDELEEFERLTSRIGAAVGYNADDETVTQLVVARRRIIESGIGKIGLLRQVLIRRNPRSIDKALIYATAKDPEQFEQIGALLDDLDIIWAPVTEETTARPDDLRRTLEAFENGGLQVLLAKKVLDEGVDIPAIREAFIIASSTVEREWIQRRGRVLRKHPGKLFALVHDFLALPPPSLLSDYGAATRKIVQTELGRAYSFANHAMNTTGPNNVLDDLKALRASFWSEGGIEPVLNSSGDVFLASAIPQGKPW